MASTIAAALSVAAVMAPAASAAPKSIAGFLGDVAGINTGGLFTAPRDVAIYTGGDSDPDNDKIFVTEALGSNSNRVQRLDAHGNFELLWGKDVIRAGAPGDTGPGAEVCSEAVSGAANCKAAPPGGANGEFRNPQGIDVNQSTGHVYVIDRDNRRVQEFDLDGQFVRAWGTEGEDPGEFGPTSADGVGIAIDPVNGDVFVADPGNGRVQQFSSTGTFVASFGALGSDPGQFGDGQPLRLAVDSNHVVYISDSNDLGRVQRYDSVADAFLAPIACCAPTAGAPLAEGVTVGLEIDPDTDGAGTDEEHLLVARDPGEGPVVVQELDIPTPPGAPMTTVVDTHVFADQIVSGIGVRSTTGDLYLVIPDIFAPPYTGSPTDCGSANTCAGLFVMTPTSISPTAAVTAADAEAKSATLTGTVNAGGGVARYRFEVSLDGDDWTDAGGGYVSGLDDVTVSTEVTGLEPNSSYQARMTIAKQTAVDQTDSVTSPLQAFMTDQAPPDVETLGSSLRSDRGARLRGRVDPNGLATTYRFEYGPAGGPLDQHVPATDLSVGAGNAPVDVFADVEGLQPNTAYEYRIVATNSVGPSTGNVVSFTTEVSVLPTPPPGRGYELVSPPDKVAGVGAGLWYTGPSASAHVGVAAYAGERFAVQGELGSVLVDGPYTYSNDWALAERTSDGWLRRPGVSRRAHGYQAKADIRMQAAADDLSLSAWGSAHTVKLFPEQEDWDGTIVRSVLFLRDWTQGMWELFGPTAQSQVVPSVQTIAEGSKAVSANGTVAVASAPGTRGLAGPGDPTRLEFGDLGQEFGSVYLDDLSDGFTDVFPGDDGVRELVNVCTEGTFLPGADGDAKQEPVACPGPLEGRDSRLISTRGASLGDDVEGIVSADGSRVFFMSPDPNIGGSASPCSGTGYESGCPTQLFVRQRGADGEVVTRWISRTAVTVANGAPEEQDASLMGPVSFEGASRDGDKVFFRTSSPLTADDPNGRLADPPAGGVTTGDANLESWDLYMYDLPDDPGADSGDGELVRVSAGPDGDGDCNVGPSALRFVSDDGSRAYFTCAAPLGGVPVAGSGSATTPEGTRASEDAANLYLREGTAPGEQSWRFVTRLPRDTELGVCATTGTTRGSALVGELSEAVNISSDVNCVNGTADGSLVTFFTDGRLTDDDPNAVTGDVYGYDASADELSRLSAPRTGAAGAGYPCTPPGTELRCYGDGGIGLRGMPLDRLGVATRPDGDRLAFFESRSQLLAEDTDNAYDVYQWREGQLSLLSTGKSTTDGAFFVGNDRSGLNVYLATRDRLTWEDEDAVLDVYTARIGGGFPEPPEHVPCSTLGDACQPPGAPPGQSQIDSKRPGVGNGAPTVRKRVTPGRLSRRARSRAARTGVVPVRIRVSAPGVLRVSARATIAGKARRVAFARKRATKAGTLTVRLRLNRMARRRLSTGRALTLRITVKSQGAATRTMRATLKRGGR